jgi:drug/metabolite transporter (DMT)-like permease
MIARPTRSDWVLLLALGFMWGTSYVFIKVGVQTLPTFTLIATRMAIGLAILLAVAVATKATLPTDRRTYGHLFLMAIINIVVPFTLITTAERSVDSALAAIINGAVPLVVIGIAAIVFHDEPITVNRLVGVIVGYFGLAVIVGPGVLAGLSSSSALGELALVGSTLAYGIGAVYARRQIVGMRPIVPAVFQVGFAFVIVTVLAFAFERPLEVSWNAEALGAVVWLGIFGSGLAYILNFRLLSRIGATRTSVLAYFLPVVGIIAGAIVFHEAIDGRVAAGTLLIIGGIALVNSRFGERRIFGRERPSPDTGAASGAAAPPAELRR